MTEGSEVTLAAYGTMINEALGAARLLAAEGISAEVIKLGTIKPNSFEKLLSSVEKTGVLVIAEELCSSGCVGSRIVTAAAERGRPIKKAVLLNLGEGIAVHGSREQLLQKYGLDALAVAKAAKKAVSEKI